VLFAGLNVLTLFPAQSLNPWMMAFLRYAFGLAVFVAILPALPGRYSLRSRRRPLHALRGFIHSAGMVLWFIALPNVDLANLTAFSFTGPLFVTIGAAIFLREVVGLDRWLAIGVGFLGAMIIIRPGLQPLSFFVISALLSVPFFACSNLLAKTLARTDSAGTIVLWQNIWIPIFCLPMAIVHWQTPGPVEIAWFVGAGLVGTLGHLAMQRGYQIADISALQPIGFLGLVWNALFGFLFFMQRPDIWTFIGAAVIFISASYFSNRQARAARNDET